MLSLGISGSLESLHLSNRNLFPGGWWHDAAAVLIEDGKVIAGIEEERLNRLKHTSKAPLSAIRFCLAQRGIHLRDLDAFAIYGTEQNYNAYLNFINSAVPEMELAKNYRQMLQELLESEFGESVDDQKLFFVPHHLTHAISAYAHSEFAHGLVISLDGGGDKLSGGVFLGRGDSLAILRTFPVSNSLGLFYNAIGILLGFGFTEEYKVMGLAPYGDPARYRQTFSKLYDLLPLGEYRLKLDVIQHLCRSTSPRKRNSPITREHTDVAAALQEALERIVLHVIQHFRKLTGESSLCLAGGVAHNCSMNGKILYSGMFENVFVHPASHDGGCAIGAALYPCLKQKNWQMGDLSLVFQHDAAKGSSNASFPRLDHVYWGSEVGSSDAIANSLQPWNQFLAFTRYDDISRRTAQLIADGTVVGWVQGRSEFGPRALGNRSIVADPRPAENKDNINAMVKKREAFRPFAPAVLDEYAEEFFELRGLKQQFQYMGFAVRVRSDKRTLLRATTHVDGTARVQIVSRERNPLFWSLIDSFRALTGVPILLNTSFNNNAEPIVDSVLDAVSCFLTTGLRVLVIGDLLIEKRTVPATAYSNLVLSLPYYVTLLRTCGITKIQRHNYLHQIGNTHNQVRVQVSGHAFDVLQRADGKLRLKELIGMDDDRSGTDAIVEEICRLWAQRLVILTPEGVAS